MSLFKRNYRGVRHGMTIVELLVVLGVLAILLGIAATAVKTGTRGKKQREAARQVNAYIAAAQAKALQINRPVGIEIARNLNDVNGDGVYTSGTDTGIGNASLLMYTIETPPPYAGDTISAGLYVDSPSLTQIDLVDDISNEVATSAAAMMSVGDIVEVRLNYRGPKYPAEVIALRNPMTMPPTPFRLRVSLPSNNRQVYYQDQFTPFQIYLQPVRTSATPLQLPTDMCIDLTCSGIGNTGNQFANWVAGSNNSIRFLFSPRGNVDRVSINGSTWGIPAGNLHMLVGKYDYAVDALDVMSTDGINEVTLVPMAGGVNYVDYLTTPSDPDLTTNLSDATAMWVSVNFLTGQITTTRNKLIQDSFITGGTFTTLSMSEQNQAILAEARDFARSVLIVQGQGDN
ncbi:prepilin-type N-terminal cleavage/methylation domain-containing protein [Bremerella sp.]|uniref:prepilin-type N-terminal cleavage/methylation domain-containing protein n=1 Tax=Bremerella sp. TaxID=2795602 RepID=UPI00391C279A